MAKRGRQNSSAVMDFLLSAEEGSDARNVIDYFRTADPADAQAALSVAKGIVKNRASEGVESSPATSRSRSRSGGSRKTSNGGARRRVVGGRDRSAGATAQGADSEAQPGSGSRRVVGGD